LNKRILIIIPRPPFPISSGGDHAQFYFIDKLRSLADLSVCFKVEDSNIKGYTELKNKWNNVTFYPYLEQKGQNLKRAVKVIKKWKSFLGRIKAIIYSFIVKNDTFPVDFIKYNSFLNHPFLSCPAGFVNFVAAVLDNHQFDMIQIEFINLAPLVYILPDKPVKVLVHHELRYIRIKREVELFETIEPSDISKLKAIEDQEISLLEKFDRIITLTDVDKDILAQRLPNVEIFVSPATIKLKQDLESEFLPFSTKLIFIGSSVHLPNKDAMHWFIGSVLPQILKVNPLIKLDIIGSWEKEFIKTHRHKNVRFLGYVDDLSQVMKTGLLIVPIRIASGMRMKILEAINFNVPFISTTIGLEGLFFKNNEDCVVADTPEEFTDAILNLSGDIHFQRKLVDNAKLKLKQLYPYDSIIERRMRFYNHI
jgi:glycosyltransferase involved in cell wall biosynthesis